MPIVLAMGVTRDLIAIAEVQTHYALQVRANTYHMRPVPAGYQASCVDDPVEARAIWYVRRGRVRSCVRPMLRGPYDRWP